MLRVNCCRSKGVMNALAREFVSYSEHGHRRSTLIELQYGAFHS